VWHHPHHRGFREDEANGSKSVFARHPSSLGTRDFSTLNPRTLILGAIQADHISGFPSPLSVEKLRKMEGLTVKGNVRKTHSFATAQKPQ
jgi:hypothetical protein